MLERAAKHGTARVAAVEMLGITAFVAADHSTCRELMEDLQDLWGVTGGAQCWAGATCHCFTEWHAVLLNSTWPCTIPTPVNTITRQHLQVSGTSNAFVRIDQQSCSGGLQWGAAFSWHWLTHAEGCVPAEGLVQ